MPVTTPTLPLPPTAKRGADGWAVCLHCDRRLRGIFGGYGWNGGGHFCSKECAAQWAEVRASALDFPHRT